MSQKFGAESTASEIAAAYSKRIEGRTVLVTGVSPGGLGSAAVLALAKGGASLIILGSRNASKAEEVIVSVKKEVPNANLRFLELDLQSLASVRKAGKAVLDYKEPLHIVINNAAIMGPYKKTEDGFESQFGGSHLGHFVLTNSIVPKLIETAKADPSYKPRIVNVSSLAHIASPVIFEDVGFQDGKTYEKFTAYGQSKTANILYAVALADRLAEHGILAYSLHPGTIRSTGVQSFPEEDLKMLGFVDEQGSWPDVIKNVFGETKVKSLDQGAATHIYAAFSPDIEKHSGAYLVDANLSKPEEVKEYATSKENADKLWSLSEQLVGETFAF